MDAGTHRHTVLMDSRFHGNDDETTNDVPDSFGGTVQTSSGDCEEPQVTKQPPCFRSLQTRPEDGFASFEISGERDECPWAETLPT
jgi:hypothetical protein